MSVPRFGDAPRRGLPPASAEEISRLMRRAGLVAALLVAWALAGAIAAAAFGRVDGLTLALLGGGPSALVALAAFALDRRAPSATKSALTAAAGTLAVSFALAGHVLFWGGVHLRLFLVSAPPALRWSAFAAVLLLVPIYAGARLRALTIGWRATGSRARGPVLTVEALARGNDLLAPVPWRAAGRGALARWAEGARLPGLMLLDSARDATRPTDVIHAEASLDVLADAIAAHGATVERSPREIVVRFHDMPAVRVSHARLLLPAGAALEVRGGVEPARRLRRVIEGAASHAVIFSSSLAARRWEYRLNALHREALSASTLEERSLVMEELDRIRRALGERNLSGQEFTVLSLKEGSTRAMLAHRMLSEPPGVRGDARVLSLHGALAPQLARVMDAGGLNAVKRVAFVPHWVLPVATRWGEQEVVVSAATGKLDASESRALLDAMRRRGPVLFLDVGAQAIFLPAPPPTAALLREMRRAGLHVSDDVATAADIIYVPYLATPEGYVSGITGAVAPDLGNAVPMTPKL